MSNKKKTLSTIILIVLTVIFTTQAQALVIRFHHDMTKNSALHEGAVEFQKQVALLSDEKMTVKLYPSNTLGDDQYAAELLQIGVIQAAVIPSSKLSNFSHEFKVLDYPYLFDTEKEAYQALDGHLGSQLLKTLNNKGMIGLGFWESGFKQLTCNNIFGKMNPHPLQNIPVRIMSSSILEEQYKTIEAIPIIMPFSELYVSLQNGIVQCQENPLVSIVNTRIYEVQNELILTNHGYLPYVFVVSRRWFDSLNDHEKRTIIHAEKIARELQRNRSSELDKTYLKTIIAYKNNQLIPEDTFKKYKEELKNMKPEDPDLKDLINMTRTPHDDKK